MTPSASAAVRQSDPSRPFPPAGLAWLVWGIAALFYAGAYFLRAAPAVMTSELMRDFHIGGASLGNLSAFYFYTYVAMQIPVGVLTSSLGARKLLALGATLAAVGAFIFGSTSSFAMACFGRAIIGGATAVSLLVLLRLTAHWFPAKNFAMMSGIGLFAGNMGAVFAQVPLRAAIEHFTWRETVLGSAAIIFGLGILSWVLVRDDPSERGYQSYAPASLQQKASMADAFRSLGSVFSFRNTWLILFAQGGLAGAILTFTGLWGLPYIRARYALSPRDAASIVTVMLLAFSVGCPVFGALSDRMGRRKPAYLGGAIAVAAGWLSMFYLNVPQSTFTVLAALTGFFTGSFIIAFAYGRESAPARFMGTMTASTNMGNMLGVVLLQPGIGWVLDRYWDGTLVNGAHIYSLPAWRAGFALLAGWSVVSVALIAMTRETYGRPAIE
jgi:sugar phosphate permease